MFDNFTISSREADIAYMEASNLFALSIDEGFITSFTEASEGEKSSKSVRNFTTYWVSSGCGDNSLNPVLTCIANVYSSLLC